MAGLNYPTSGKSRIDNRARLSSPLGPQDVRNPNRVQFPGIDLREGSSPALSGRSRPVNVNGVLHGEILGPSGRPLDSSKAATVRNAVKALTIEGELGRPNSPKAQRLRAMLQKLLGPMAARLLGVLGLVGLAADFWSMFGVGTKGSYTHPNGNLQWSCTPNVISPSYGTWIEGLVTGPAGAAASPSCGSIFRNHTTSYPEAPTGYPLNQSWGPVPTTVGYAMWRYSSQWTTFDNSRAFQVAARYATADVTKPLGPVWVGQAIPLPDLWPFPQVQLGPRTVTPPKAVVLTPPKAYQLPGQEIAVDIRPGQPPRPPGKPVDFNHNQLPPTGRVREKKARGVPLAVALAGMATEACELVTIAYRSLPKKLTRWKGRDGKFRDQHISCHERALFVWQNAGQIDMDKFVDGVKWNMVEDALYGTLGRARGATGRGVDVSRIPHVD